MTPGIFVQLSDVKDSFSKTLAPDRTKPDDGDDSKDVVVAAELGGPDARMGDWETT